MKVHYLLLALAVGALGCASAKPLLVNPQPTQIAQSAQIADNSSSQADPQTAQNVAAKVTVRIRVGQGMGSGVLLGRKGNTYLVLTNAHVVREDAGISIQTPDGQSYTARKVKDPQVGNFDVALLEFTSNRVYQLAKSDVSSKDEFALTEGKPIFAAGFAHDSNTLTFRSGEVKQLPQEPFVNGTQVGYAIKGDIEQGMSGGPILDKAGNLVGINSTYAYPIKPVYTYADGTKAPPDKVAEYRQANWGVPIYNLLTRLNPDILYSYKQLPKLHRTVTPSGYMAGLDRQARLVTVRIENSGGNGSGVIVASDGNSYSVLTAAHVVEKIQNLRVITHDQRTYTISPNDIKRSQGTDLAVIKFTSTQRYQVAALGNYSMSDGAVVFAGGWPAPWLIGSQQWQWQLNPGTISNKEKGAFKAQDKESFSKTSGSYDSIYSSNTYGGMSGGPIFDSVGRVIGIHGKAEGNRISRNILGNSLGISIKAFLGDIDRLTVPKSSLKPISTEASSDLDSIKLKSVSLLLNNLANPNNSKNAMQWIEYGNQLYRLQKYADAISAFDRAIDLCRKQIALNHDDDLRSSERLGLIDAYYGRGLALNDSLNFVAGLKSFNLAIELVLQLPQSDRAKFYYLWKYQSISYKYLGNNKEALQSISSALNLEENDLFMLNEKAVLFMKLKQYSEAVKIYDLIIAIEPKSWFYDNRGNAKSELKDYNGALSDYDTAIKIDPNLTSAYVNRGNTKFVQREYQQAVENYSNAIRIDPKFELAYVSRGFAKHELNNYEGAITDFTTAIQSFDEAYRSRGIAIDSRLTFAKAYYGRGVSKIYSQKYNDAIDDFDIALKINPRDISAYLKRAFAKHGLKNYREAINDFTIVIQLAPEITSTYYNRGISRFGLGDIKGAISDYDNAIRLDPKSDTAYYFRGIAKAKLGDVKGAISDYDNAIQLNSRYETAYYFRGIAKTKLGDVQGAISDYDNVIRLNPKSDISYYNRGIAKDELGDVKGAVSDLDNAIKINPKYADSYSNRGLIRIKLGDKGGAIADLNIAAQLYKDQNNAVSYKEAMDLVQKISK